MKKITLVIALLLPFLINAQEEHVTKNNTSEFETKHHELERFRIALTMSQSYIPSLHTEEGETTAQFIPTNGIEISFALTHKLYVKWINEIEFQNYTVKGHNGEHRIRENAFLTAAVLIYEIYDHVGLFAGGGYEFEKNENLWVARFGAEYVFELPKNWNIAPTIIFDYKAESHTAYTFSLSIGKKF
jgi:hypothetical protein